MERHLRASATMFDQVVQENIRLAKEKESAEQDMDLAKERRSPSPLCSKTAVFVTTFSQTAVFRQTYDKFVEDMEFLCSADIWWYKLTLHPFVDCKGSRLEAQKAAHGRQACRGPRAVLERTAAAALAA